jgi:hypothetical protein
VSRHALGRVSDRAVLFGALCMPKRRIGFLIIAGVRTHIRQIVLQHMISLRQKVKLNLVNS